MNMERGESQGCELSPASVFIELFCSCLIFHNDKVSEQCADV